MADGLLEALRDDDARTELVLKVIEQLDEETRQDSTFEVLEMLISRAAHGNDRKPLAILSDERDVTINAFQKESQWGLRFNCIQTLYGRRLNVMSGKVDRNSPNSIRVRYHLSGPNSVTYTSLDGLFSDPINRTVSARDNEKIGMFDMKNLEAEALGSTFIGLQKPHSSGQLSVARKYHFFSDWKTGDSLIVYCDRGKLSFFDLEGTPVQPFEGRVKYYRRQMKEDAEKIKTLYDATQVHEFRERARLIMQVWWYSKPHHFKKVGQKLVLQSTLRIPTDGQGLINLVHFDRGKRTPKFPGHEDFIGRTLELRTRGKHILYYDEDGELVRGYSMKSPYLHLKKCNLDEAVLHYYGIRNINIADPVRYVHNDWRYFFSKDELLEAVEYRRRLSVVGLFAHVNDFNKRIEFEIFSRTSKGEFLHLPITPYRKEKIS